MTLGMLSPRMVKMGCIPLGRRKVSPLASDISKKGTRVEVKRYVPV